MLNVLINGIPTETVKFKDRGLQYGDGLFETMLVKDNVLRNQELHWQRLLEGCKRLNIPSPDLGLLNSEIRTLVKNSSSAEIVVKLILTRGEGERGYQYSGNEEPTRILSSYTASQYPDHYFTEGINVHLCNTRLSENKSLAGIKHLNRLEQVLARSERDDSVYQEGIMQDQHGMMVDGTFSNLFVVKNKRLFTPDLSLAGVAGVMRQYVIDIARNSGIEVEISQINFDTMCSADEVFMTNSLIGIWPVKAFEKYKYDSPGQLTTGIMRKLEE